MGHFKISEFPHHLHLEFFAPKEGNSLGLSSARELSAIQKKYKNWKRPIVVSSSHPTLFCSGGNLSDYKKLKGKAPGLKVNAEIQKHLSAFAAWPAVKLALVEGDVLGGGLEWLACFDYRWSTPHALFCFFQRRIGLSPGWGGGSRWSAIVGEENVRKLLVESEMISAGAALHGGIIDRVHSSWKIREAVVDWALRIDTEAAQSLLRWKALSEKQIFGKLWMGPAHRAALARWK